jgi:hypothetical protein
MADTDVIDFTGMSVSSVTAAGGKVTAGARDNGVTLKLRHKPGCTGGKVTLYY